jgi:hypothetical protein
LFTATGEADRVALVSDSLRATETPPVFSSSELSELSEDEEPELLDSGRGVFFASFRAFESAFLAVSFSDPEDSESESESEESLELLELLEPEESEESEESESEEEDSDEEESDSVLETLAFLDLGASSSEESESELESEDDSLLDSALRFTPVCFFTAGEGMGAASSSLSSSASLSELELEEEDEEGEDARAALVSFLGASSISTSESLASLSELELLSLSESLLSLSELEESLDSFAADFFSHDWKMSRRDGALFTSA